jgi:hypothetical protein
LGLNDQEDTGATLGGPVAAIASYGTVVFTGLRIGEPGAYSLTLGGNHLVSAETDNIDVTGARATRLIFATQPPSRVTAGAPFEVDVTAVDSHGNPDPHFQGSVTLSLGSGSNLHALGGTLTQNAVNGVAAFPGLQLNQTGSGYTLVASGSSLTQDNTGTFVVTAPGVAARLVITTQPPATITAGGSFGLTVAAVDGFGQLDPAFNGIITLAVDNGATLGGTFAAQAFLGMASFPGLTLDQAGDYMLTASAGVLAPATTSSITVNGTAASQLVVGGPTGAVAVGWPFAVNVLAVDPYGNFDPTFNGSITLSLANNPSGATFGGTLSVTAVDGIAQFTGLTLDRTGTGYVIQASATGLAAGSATAFDVLDSQLAVVTEPPSVVLTGRSFGLVVTALTTEPSLSFNGNVTVALLKPDGSNATLLGTLTVTPLNGVATFSGLMITQPGTFQIEVTSAGLVDTVTDSFDVTGAPPARSALAISSAAKRPAISAGGSLSSEITYIDNGDTIADLSSAPLTSSAGITS